MKMKYKCPYCSVNSYSKYWNAETFKKYGTYSDEICEIQLRETNSWHICPNCKKESEMFKGELICIKSNEPKCNYCNDTGRIGNPLELNCTPCTDCDIWSDMVERVKVDSYAEGHQSTESTQAKAGGRKGSGGSYE